MSDSDFVTQSAIKSLILHTYILFNLFSPLDSARLEKATAAKERRHPGVSCFSVYLGKATAASRAALPQSCQCMRCFSVYLDKAATPPEPTGSVCQVI